MQTRQKLQPFVDEGFIYKDRKIASKKNEKMKGKEKKARQDAELQERILAYKDKINECIKHKRIYELEQVLNELGLA